MLALSASLAHVSRQLTAQPFVHHQRSRDYFVLPAIRISKSDASMALNYIMVSTGSHQNANKV